MHALQHRLPDRSVGGHGQILAHDPIQFFSKSLGRTFRPIESHNGEFFRQELPGHEIVDGWKQFPLRKIAVDPENDHHARSTKPGKIHSRP